MLPVTFASAVLSRRVYPPHVRQEVSSGNEPPAWRHRRHDRGSPHHHQSMAIKLGQGIERGLGRRAKEWHRPDHHQIDIGQLWRPAPTGRAVYPALGGDHSAINIDAGNRRATLGSKPDRQLPTSALRAFFRRDAEASDIPASRAACRTPLPAVRASQAFSTLALAIGGRPNLMDNLRASA